MYIEQVYRLASPTFAGLGEFKTRIFERFGRVNTPDAIFVASGKMLAIVGPRYDEFAGEFEAGWHYDRSTGKWAWGVPALAKEFILSAVSAGKIILQKWRKPRPRLAQELFEQHREFVELQAQSDITAARKRKIQPNNRRPPRLSKEYEAASRVAYSTYVEINGKKRFVRGNLCEYLDGKTPEGYRPLIPEFPVKSGKR